MKEIDDFRNYLEQKEIVEKNITRMVNLLKSWLEWLPIEVEDSKYKHLLDYIGHLQKQEKSTHHINRSLQTISHYILLHRNQDSEKFLSPQADDYNQLHWQFKKLSKHLKQEAKTKLNIEIQKLNHLRQSRVSGLKMKVYEKGNI